MSSVQGVKSGCLIGSLIEDVEKNTKKLTVYANKKIAFAVECKKPNSFFQNLIARCTLTPIKYYDEEKNKCKTVYYKPVTSPTLPIGEKTDSTSIDWMKPIQLPENCIFFEYAKKKRNLKNKKIDFPFEAIKELSEIKKTLEGYSKSISQIVTSEVQIDENKYRLLVDVTPNGLGSYIILKTIEGGSYKKVYVAYDLDKNKIVTVTETKFAPIIVRGEIVKNPAAIAINEHRMLHKIKTEFDKLPDRKHRKFFRGIPKPYKVTYHTIEGIDYQFMVMRYCNKENILNSVLKIEFSAKEIWDIILKAARVIQFFHAINYLHRDIKVDNIFCDEDEGGILEAYLGDYGFSCPIELLNDVPLGSPGYLAPEILHKYLDENDKDLFSFESDIFAFGVTMWGIITRHFPEASGLMIKAKKCRTEKEFINHVDTVYTMMQADNPVPDDATHISFLLQWATLFDRSNRPTIQQVIDYITANRSSLECETEVIQDKRDIKDLVD